MLRHLRNLPLLCSEFIGRSDIRISNVTRTKKLNFSNQIFDIKHFHICSPLYINCTNSRPFAREHVRKVEKDETKSFDFPVKSGEDIYPDLNLPDRLFKGTPFKELPIVNIKATRNNTIMNLTDHRGFTKLIRSCGIEGFKNAKKGTSLAAQATALTFTRRALEMGYKTVRVRMQGMGPGRFSSVRGLVIGGFDIVSVTDNSHVADVYPRPKKLRRI